MYIYVALSSRGFSIKHCLWSKSRHWNLFVKVYWIVSFVPIQTNYFNQSHNNNWHIEKKNLSYCRISFNFIFFRRYEFIPILSCWGKCMKLWLSPSNSGASMKYMALRSLLRTRRELQNLARHNIKQINGRFLFIITGPSENHDLII